MTTLIVASRGDIVSLQLRDQRLRACWSTTTAPPAGSHRNPPDAVPVPRLTLVRPPRAKVTLPAAARKWYFHGCLAISLATLFVLSTRKVSQELTFRQLLSTVVRRGVIVLLCIVAAVAGSALYLAKRSPSYQSTATVQLEIPTAANSQPLLTLPDPSNTVRSGTITSSVAKLLGQRDPGSLASHVSASFDSSTNLLSITTSSVQPALCASSG